MARSATKERLKSPKLYQCPTTTSLQNQEISSAELVTCLQITQTLCWSPRCMVQGSLMRLLSLMNFSTGYMTPPVLTVQELHGT